MFLPAPASAAGVCLADAGSPFLAAGFAAGAAPFGASFAAAGAGSGGRFRVDLFYAVNLIGLSEVFKDEIKLLGRQNLHVVFRRRGVFFRISEIAFVEL